MADREREIRARVEILQAKPEAGGIPAFAVEDVSWLLGELWRLRLCVSAVLASTSEQWIHDTLDDT